MIYIVNLNGELCDVQSWPDKQIATGVALITEKVSIVIAPIEWSAIVDEYSAVKTYSGEQWNSCFGGHGKLVPDCTTIENNRNGINLLCDELNGMINTKALIDYLKDTQDDYFEQKHYNSSPSAEWCNVYYNGFYNAGMWYMPAIGEIIEILKYRTEINIALEKIDAMAIKQSYYTPYRLLSSTQCCKDSAWMCYPDESDDKMFFPDCKCTPASIRPICKYIKKDPQ